MRILQISFLHATCLLFSMNKMGTELRALVGLKDKRKQSDSSSFSYYTVTTQCLRQHSCFERHRFFYYPFGVDCWLCRSGATVQIVASSLRLHGHLTTLGYTCKNII